MLVAPLCIIMAQGPAIALQTVCWTTPSAVDSNITAYWLISSRDSVPRLINYLDAQGQTVNVSAGGTYQNGYCCCTGGGSGDTYRTVASQTDSLLGLTTFTVGFIDTVGLDIASLVQSAPKGDGYLVFYDELTNRNYKILLSSLMPEPYPGYTSCECDTIYQVAHGFALGDVVGQVRGNGLFFTATTGNADSLPVAYVHEVLHADTFVIKSEGWLMDWTHGLPLGRDYFIQDDGSRDTIPDSTYSAFAFRTINTTKAYFDIPELVVDQSPGSGSGGATGDADWYAEGTSSPPSAITESIYTYGDVGIGTNAPNAGVDIEDTTSVVLRWQVGGRTLASFNKAISGTGLTSAYYPRLWFRSPQASNDLLIQIHPVGTTYFDSTQIFRIGYTATGPDTPGSDLWVTGASYLNGPLYDSKGVGGTIGDLSKYFGADASGDATWRPSAFYEDASGNIIANTANIPDYANDAAADADGALPSGAVYQVTAEDRTIRIKP